MGAGVTRVDAQSAADRRILRNFPALPSDGPCQGPDGLGDLGTPEGMLRRLDTVMLELEALERAARVEVCAELLPALLSLVTFEARRLMRASLALGPSHPYAQWLKRLLATVEHADVSDADEVRRLSGAMSLLKGELAERGLPIRFTRASRSSKRRPAPRRRSR